MSVFDIANMGNSYNSSYSANLLVSALLRYPEIGTISCSREEQTLALKFILAENHNIEGLQDTLKQALDLYHKIEGRKMTLFQMYRHGSEPGLLVIKRDLVSMTQTEMNLIVEILKKECGNNLIKEENNLPEDENIFQDEIINHMLTVLRSNGTEKSFTAVREEGKVLVFNS
jgi:hypothetical protein